MKHDTLNNRSDEEHVTALYDLEAERAVLGGILLDHSVLSGVEAIVSASDFYHPGHGLIFEATHAVVARGQPIDIVTLAAELRRRDRLNTVGGPQYLGELTDSIPTVAHIGSHAQIVADLGRSRRAAGALTEALERLNRGEPLDGPVERSIEETLAREGRRATLMPVTDTLRALTHAWEHPTLACSTNFSALDELLAGGLRAGDMIGVVGSAGGGKSAFVGQVALDASKSGAAVVYASVEMPPSEIVARWLALEFFRTAEPSGHDVSLGYRDIYYGHAWRGEIAAAEAQSGVLIRLQMAAHVLESVGDRVFVEQIEPGSTVDDLRALVATVRSRLSQETSSLVLVVDPLQRFFASERGGRRGRAAEGVNASETERVGAVAQELKYLADTEKITVIFTSDTTKAAALSATSSAGSMRGSYQINHLATLVLGLHTGANARELRERLNGRGKDAEPVASLLDEKSIEASLPMEFWHRDDAKRLGACAAVLECSKNRRGPARSFALGFIPGAACFVQSEVREFQPVERGKKK